VELELRTEIRMITAWRSHAEQVCLKQKKGNLAAAPGTSEHEKGLAVDIVDVGLYNRFRSIFSKNNLCRPIPQKEDWHVEYRTAENRGQAEC